MGKLTTYLVVMLGVTALFYFFGLIENTGANLLLNLILDPASIASTKLYTVITTAVTAIVGVAVSIFAGKEKSDFAITSLIITALLNLGWSFFSVFQKVADASYILAILIVGPFIALWFFTVIEWWRGVDT